MQSVAGPIKLKRGDYMLFGTDGWSIHANTGPIKLKRGDYMLFGTDGWSIHAKTIGIYITFKQDLETIRLLLCA